MLAPIHMNATVDDLSGNNGIGRYIFLPGSDGRAQAIAEHFSNAREVSHPRGHNVYLGTLNFEDKTIDVATVATGMGCPSMEIILHELFYLGAKRFLRVGTAGSLQSKHIKIGDIINVQASVRDEDTTSAYMPISIPAIASLEMISAIDLASKKLNLHQQLHTGTVHCKSSFYGREFGAGPRAQENFAYIDLLTQCGILASEMETAALFIQSQLYNYELQQLGKGPAHRVLSGSILGILAIPPDHYGTKEEAKLLTQDTITLALETIKILATTELKFEKIARVPEIA